MSIATPGIFLAKQILDRLPSFAKFDNDKASQKSAANRIYSNPSLAKAEVALMTLGKIGRYGYQLMNGLYPGNQHSQKVFPELKARTAGGECLFVIQMSQATVCQAHLSSTQCTAPDHETLRN